MISRCAGSLLVALTIHLVGCAPALRFKAIYLDMDGTALRTSADVHPATVEALRRFRACGGRVGIASGRTWEQIRPYLSAIGPDLPIVTFNGALVVDPMSGRPLFKAAPIPPAEVERVLNYARTSSVVEGVVVHLSEVTYADRTTQRFTAFQEHSKIGPVIMLSEPGTPPSGVLKLLLLTPAKTAVALRTRLAGILGSECRAVVTSPTTVEVMRRGVDKGQALVVALDLAGQRSGSTIVFGDGDNDIEMLRAAGLGVAMENCTPMACQSATVRGGSNDGDAIAQMVYRVALGEGCSGN